MNTNHAIVLLTAEEATTLKARFTRQGRIYTFRVLRSLAEKLEVGDRVVAKLNNGQFKIVQVDSIDKEPDIELDAVIDYTWVFQKVDMEQIEELTAQDERIANDIYRMRTQQARHQLLESLGIPSNARLSYDKVYKEGDDNDTQ